MCTTNKQKVYLFWGIGGKFNKIAEYAILVADFRLFDSLLTHRNGAKYDSLFSGETEFSSKRYTSFNSIFDFAKDTKSEIWLECFYWSLLDGLS